MPKDQAFTQLEQFSELSVSELLKTFNCSLDGLDSSDAVNRLYQYGPNELATKSQTSIAWRFVRMFLAPLPLMLIALSVISYLTGEHAGSMVIGLMIFLSILLTFIQEHKSGKAAERLQAMVATKNRVLRDRQVLEVPLREVVPGDLVLLSAGTVIPGDLYLIESKNLFINEAALTGESLPIEKNVMLSEKTITSTMPVNLCLMGSHVVSGLGQGLVLRTGKHTLFGELARAITSELKISSFDQGVQKYIGLMIRFMVVMVPMVFLINGLTKGDWLEAALFALALAVGLTPEMLPLLVTINLAKGALVMAKKNVIIKRLPAIQNLGAMNILCADKTGTLTQDRVILEQHIDVFGKPSRQVLEFAYLNSYYQAGLKNLLDVAILEHVEVHEQLHSRDTYTKIDEIPFDFQRRRMSVVLQRNHLDHVLICKGAVEEVFSCCRFAQSGDQTIALDATHLQRFQEDVAKLNQAGYRVIAVASKVASAGHTDYEIADENDLVLMGYVAFLDPPKESAKPAIHQLLRYGVEVKILSGDSENVCRKICQDVGLNVQQVATGSAIEAMTDEELTQLVKVCSVFVKMTPQQKLRIIRLLQHQGNTVGYLGDGINDGPSLKAADVSISVDNAIDIAKESADIILLEKNLMILKNGVLEGRKVFGNLMKYLKITSSSNFGNVISLMGASVLLPFLPMAPVQILVNDLLYDLSQSAVPTDQVDDEYLKSPKTWDIKSITNYMYFIGPISSVFDYLLFGYLWFFLDLKTVASSNIFQTGWFTESLLSQIFIVYVLRTSKIPFFESRPSTSLLLTTLTIAIVAIALPFMPFTESLNLAILPTDYWYGLLIFLGGYVLLMQLIKSQLVKRFGWI